MKKPQQISRLLVAGLAAFSFFTVNCSNSSRRSIKAQVNSKGQAGQLANLPPCNEKAIQAISVRNSTMNDIKKIFADSQSHELDAAAKTQLQKLGVTLKTNSTDLIEAIKGIKQNGGAALGCNIVDPKDSAKKISTTIAGVGVEDQQTAAKIAELTKGMAPVDDDGKKIDDTVDDSVLAENISYKISAELAAVLVEQNKDGKAYVLDQKIRAGEKAQEELKQVIEKNEKSVCFFELVGGEYKENDVLTVKVISQKVAADGKSVSAKVVFAGTDGKLSSMACSSPNVISTNEELRRTFGKLLILNSQKN